MMMKVTARTGRMMTWGRKQGRARTRTLKWGLQKKKKKEEKREEWG